MTIKNIYNSIILILYFFFFEIKIFKTRIINLFYYFKQLQFRSYLSKTKIFKNEYLNNFLKLNSKINIKKKIYETKNKIIIESFINHPHYTLPQCIIAKKLSEVYKLECVGLVRKGDIVAESIMKSFKINKILRLNNGNIFLRFFFLFENNKNNGFQQIIKMASKLQIQSN